MAETIRFISSFLLFFLLLRLFHFIQKRETTHWRNSCGIISNRKGVCSFENCVRQFFFCSHPTKLANNFSLIIICKFSDVVFVRLIYLLFFWFIYGRKCRTSLHFVCGNFCFLHNHRKPPNWTTKIPSNGKRKFESSNTNQEIAK